MSRRRLVIVGGGITGLAAAHAAVTSGEPWDVTVLEAGSQPGGLLRTARRDGMVIERGPDSMITDKPWGIELARRVGLEDQIISTGPDHRRSFVVAGGRLEPVPEGFQLLAPARFAPLLGSRIFSLGGKLRMGMDLFIPRRSEDRDESLGDFVLRRLGREALERMAEPMIAGIYGGDPMQLSLRATLPRFHEMERDHGSVIRGMWARSRHAAEKSGVSGARYGLFVSFRGGMQSLADGVLAALPPGTVRPMTPVDSLRRSRNDWELRLRSGEVARADAVLVASPAHLAAKALAELDAELSRELAAIPYASAATITLVYDRDLVAHPLNGFGFVVPSRERMTILGCTFSHVKWHHRAPAGTVLLRAFFGNQAVETMDDTALEAAARRDLEPLLGITGAPKDREVARAPRAMPHYLVGHLERVERIEALAARHPGLALAGNAYRGVGIPDSVRSGEEAARRLLDHQPSSMAPAAVV